MIIEGYIVVKTKSKVTAAIINVWQVIDEFDCLEKATEFRNEIQTFENEYKIIPYY